MYVYYRGDSETGIHYFREMLNLRRSTWYCETTLHSPGYLPCLGYIYKRCGPSTLLNT